MISITQNESDVTAPIKVDMDSETVSARELHESLGIEKRFSAWFEQFKDIFVENEDYTSVLTGTEVQNNGGVQVRDLQDYKVSIDMAKHICMMSHTEKGKECRQYFIDLEKAWNTPEQIMSRALRIADNTINNLKIENATLKPKAAFFDAVADSKTAVSMNDVAKTLNITGMGRNNLFEFLRNNKILDEHNKPYQKYCDMGYFRLIEQHYTKDGEECISFKTLVYQKGVDYIRRMLKGEKTA